MHYLLHVSLFFLLFFNSLYANNDRSLQLKQMQNESRHALVVGNSSYKSLSTLKNPVHDARAMRDALIERGFDVQYLENATYRNFEKQIKKFAMRLKNGGVGLFYYAGHGIEVDGKNYLVATDSDISEEDEVKYETVALNWIIDKMKHAHPRVNILILDACRNNPFSRSAGGGLAAPPNARGMFIAYATEAGKVAADGSGKHGVFTKYLIQNLNRPIDINAVFNQTQRDVLRATNQKQFPVMYDKFIGSFFFTLPAKTNISKRKSSYSFTSQKPKSYTLTINPTPYDAKVQITNIKPRYYKAMPLQPGSYTIKVSKQGYITKTGKIDLYEDLDIDIVLERKALHVNNSFVSTPSYTSTKNYETYTEVHGYHILLHNINEAKELISKMEGLHGEKLKQVFMELARRYSEGPTASRGGDLGFYKKGQMVLEFEKASFSAKAGTIVKVPIKTMFGYHVIYIEEKR